MAVERQVDQVQEQQKRTRKYFPVRNISSAFISPDNSCSTKIQKEKKIRTTDRNRIQQQAILYNIIFDFLYFLCVWFLLLLKQQVYIPAVALFLPSFFLARTKKNGTSVSDRNSSKVRWYFFFFFFLCSLSYFLNFNSVAL